MAKQQQATFPLTVIPAGLHGPVTSPVLPSDVGGYILDFSNDVTWPLLGDVCAITIEQSNDGGATWAFDASITLAGGLWRTRAGAFTNSSSWSVSINNQGSTTRKIRAWLNALQACTLGVTISST